MLTRSFGYLSKYELILLITTFTEYFSKNCRSEKPTTLPPVMNTTSANMTFQTANNSTPSSENGLILAITLPAALIGFTILLAVVSAFSLYSLNKVFLTCQS